MDEEKPKRVQAREMWIASKKKMPMAEIAKAFGVCPSTVYHWRSEDNWGYKKRKKGCGAPKGNKNGLKTGKDERITFGDLTDEERELLSNLNEHETAYWALLQQRDLLFVRQHRMLKRLSELRKTKEEMITVKTATEMSGRKQGEPNRFLKSAEAEALDDRIIRLEKVLTDVQGELRRTIDSMADLNENSENDIRAKLGLFQAIAKEAASINAS